MKIRDIAEWLFIADDDLDTAQNLPISKKEHICYHCSQAAEKYLKVILVQHDILPKPFNHNLSAINKICCDFYPELKKYKKECDALTDYTTKIRYPGRIQLTNADVKYVLDAAEAIKNSQPLQNLRTMIENEHGKNWKNKLFNDVITEVETP